MTKNREFLFSYHYGGRTWGLSIFADSPAEAMEKVKAAGMARYDGELVARVPAVPGGGMLARLICWWKSP